MTSWTTCWSGSLHLHRACQSPASRSICPRSFSMAWWWSTTASVPFFSVSKHLEEVDTHTPAALQMTPCPLFRGTSVHCHPAPETKRHPENRLAWPQQVRSSACVLERQKNHPSFLLLSLFHVCQTTCAPVRRRVSNGGDRRSSGSFIWSDAPSGPHAQPGRHNTGGKTCIGVQRRRGEKKENNSETKEWAPLFVRWLGSFWEKLPLSVQRKGVHLLQSWEEVLHSVL